jgi:hypothetical protein
MLVQSNGTVVAGVSAGVAGLLQQLVREAVKKFNSGEIGFTEAQMRMVARHPRLFSREKGNVIDSYVKNKLARLNDPTAERLYLTRNGEFGPDVTDLGSLPDWVTWYDITTEKAWGAHFDKYYEVFGPNGQGIFWDVIEGEEMAGGEGAGEE